MIYGTAWKRSDTSRLVADAIRSGFRFVDTACQPRHYFEAGVGEGWVRAAQELGLSRRDVHLQTKYTAYRGQDPKNIPYDPEASLEDQVRQSLARSLENLKTTYIDSLVLHSPMETHEETMRVWRTFESFVEEGTVRSLGISNCYDLDEFAALYDDAQVKPTWLQNRFYSNSNFDVKLRAYCAERGVHYQSFWTLTANRAALASSEVGEFARSKGLTPQTLMYAFVMRLGHSPLSGTTDGGHMEEDAELMRRVQRGERIFQDDNEVRRMADLLSVPLDDVPPETWRDAPDL